MVKPVAERGQGNGDPVCNGTPVVACGGCPVALPGETVGVPDPRGRSDYVCQNVRFVVFGLGNQGDPGAEQAANQGAQGNQSRPLDRVFLRTRPPVGETGARRASRA